MPVITNIDDLRRMAQKRVARAISDYVARGSYDEQTLRANRADLEALRFRQRVAIDVDRRSTRTTMAGEEASMPVAIAPVGLTGLNWADGEILGVYRKSHIPDGPGYQEKYYFRPGDTGFKTWNAKPGHIGVGICWDQWFPETARAMAVAGAEVLFYPTAIGSEPYDASLDTHLQWLACKGQPGGA